MRQQSGSVRGIPHYSKMADEREKRVQDHLEYKVRCSVISLNVEANLEVMRNSAVGMERLTEVNEKVCILLFKVLTFMKIPWYSTRM